MAYDPKQKKHTPFRTLMKIAAALLFAVGALVAMRIQKGLMKKYPAGKSGSTLTANMPAENIETGFSVANPREAKLTAKRAPKKKAAAAAPAQKKVEPVVVTKEVSETPRPTSVPGLGFDTHKPVIVLSLPHSADLAIARFFKCGGVAAPDMGKYWTHTHTEMPLGRCMQNNLMNNANMTHDCGTYSVYAELHFIEAAKTKGKTKHPARCFDPVLFPGALDQLYKAIPNAHAITVRQDPLNWYADMPKDLKAHWKKFCNPTHMELFPTSAHSKLKFQSFYHDYHERLDTFLQQHKGWTSIEIDLDQDMATTGAMLQSHLKIPSKCWTKSIDAPLRNGAGNVELPKQRLPTTINYPILSVGLPKSGISSAHHYFRCALGVWATAQQWTTPSKSTEENPAQDTPIGMCIQNNMKEGVNNILKGCGHARVWGDIGYIRDKTNGGTCYFPTMAKGVLEQYASYYPRSTILHMVRPAKDWYSSAKTFNSLPARWSAAKNCRGFPETGASVQDWEDFYDKHTESVRDFARNHPNITYIEIPLSDEGGEMLQEIFQFPERCWQGNKDDK